MPRIVQPKLPTATAKRQVEKRALWNDARSPESAHFFTLGYTGRKIEELFDLLISNGVRTLVDIRKNPVSMYRPELSKSNLQRLTESYGLIYEHRAYLGVPKDVRVEAADAGTRDVIWRWYDEHVIPLYPGKNLHHFLNSLVFPVALMCVEIDPMECHRHRLFLALEEMGLNGFDL